MLRKNNKLRMSTCEIKCLCVNCSYKPDKLTEHAMKAQTQYDYASRNTITHRYEVKPRYVKVTSISHGSLSDVPLCRKQARDLPGRQAKCTPRSSHAPYDTRNRNWRSDRKSPVGRFSASRVGPGGSRGGGGSGGEAPGKKMRF